MWFTGLKNWGKIYTENLKFPLSASLFSVMPLSSDFMAAVVWLSSFSIYFFRPERWYVFYCHQGKAIKILPHAILFQVLTHFQNVPERALQSSFRVFGDGGGGDCLLVSLAFGAIFVVAVCMIASYRFIQPHLIQSMSLILLFLKAEHPVERQVGGGIGMGNTCNSMADSCQCMTKPTTIV